MQGWKFKVDIGEGKSATVKKMIATPEDDFFSLRMKIRRSMVDQGLATYEDAIALFTKDGSEITDIDGLEKEARCKAVIVPKNALLKPKKQMKLDKTPIEVNSSDYTQVLKDLFKQTLFKNMLKSELSRVGLSLSDMDSIDPKDLGELCISIAGSLNNRQQ